MLSTCIAVDFDDVICSYTPFLLRYINRVHNTSLCYDSLTTQDIPTLLGLDVTSGASIFRAFEHSDEHNEMHNTPPSEECVRVLTSLSQRYTLVVITARGESLRTVTHQYLDWYLPGIFHAVYLANCYGTVGERYTKKHFCRQHGCEVLLDDSPSHVASVTSASITGVLFGSYPWNRDVTPVHRAKSWAAFETMMDAPAK